MWRKPQLLLLSVALSLGVHAAEKRKPAQEFVRPNQIYEIADAPAKFPVAARGCANDVFATAVAIITEANGVKLPAKDWSVRIAGGDACLQTLPDFDALRKSVEGDYSLGNGKRYRIDLVRSEGPPTAADPLAIQLALNRPVIFIVKGQPLLLYGLTFDEHIINNLRKELWITEMRLVNLAAKPDSEQRVVTIRREDGAANDIEAVVRVRVTPIELLEMDKR